MHSSHTLRGFKYSLLRINTVLASSMCYKMARRWICLLWSFCSPRPPKSFLAIIPLLQGDNEQGVWPALCYSTVLVSTIDTSAFFLPSYLKILSIQNC